MNFGQAIGSGFRNNIGFGGRACRSEYWYWALFSALASLSTIILDGAIFLDGEFFPNDAIGPLDAFLVLVLFLPSIALLIRRLHDINVSGWLVLIVFVPIIGLILFVVWGILKGDKGNNRFGPNPLAPLAS
ncbi:MAG: DUF805 domain-containing protein [Alphaproteobacteria bacterium]